MSQGWRGENGKTDLPSERPFKHTEKTQTGALRETGKDTLMIDYTKTNMHNTRRTTKSENYTDRWTGLNGFLVHLTLSASLSSLNGKMSSQKRHCRTLWKTKGVRQAEKNRETHTETDEKI